MLVLIYRRMCKHATNPQHLVDLLSHKDIYINIVKVKILEKKIMQTRHRHSHIALNLYLNMGAANDFFLAANNQSE